MAIQVWAPKAQVRSAAPFLGLSGSLGPSEEVRARSKFHLLGACFSHFNGRSFLPREVHVSAEASLHDFENQ